MNKAGGFGDQFLLGIDEDTEQELKKLIPEHPLHILDLNATSDYSVFQTPLRTVFELYARRSNKKQFLDYVSEHEECRHLDMETHEVIKQLMGSSRLRSLLEKQEQKEEEEEEDQNMWKAVEDLIEDSKQEGRQAGEASQIISIIDSMMEKLHCTLEEACEYAGKTLEEYQQAKALV